MQNTEESLCFKPSKMKEFVVDFEGRRCSEMQCAKRRSQDFRYDCENFAGDSCHGRVSEINKICFLCSSYFRSQATAA